MMKKTLILLLGILMATFVVALIFPPHQFRGDVTVNNVAAPDGLLITAKMENASGDLEAVAATSTKNGAYGKSGSAVMLILDPDGDRTGETIYFYVDDVEAATHEYGPDHLAEDVTVVNLDVSGDFGVCGDTVCSNGETCSTCSADCGSCPVSTPTTTSSGGGGGGGGGGSYIRKVENETDDALIAAASSSGLCVPKWKCSDWLDCVNGLQKRFCLDLNECNGENVRPDESKMCDMPIELKDAIQDLQPQLSLFEFITGAAIGPSDNPWKGYGFAVMIIGAIALMLTLYYRFTNRPRP